MHVLSPVFQALPVEGLEHDCDAGSVVVHTENISSRPTLDHLKFLYVFLSVRVPHITGILYQGGGGGGGGGGNRVFHDAHFCAF